jgi:putative photosynthetic complex assembly protein
MAQLLQRHEDEMSEIFAQGTFPRRAVHAGALIVLLSVGVAGFARWTGIGTTRLSPSPVVQSLSLRFFDNPQGGVGVETSSGEGLAQFAPGEGGFLRGVLRGFARDRRAQGIGSEPPFLLMRHADGRISLSDPQTGRVVELDAFGPTNAGLFAKFLTQGKE